MGYQHGKFVWFTLLASDIDRAKSFYSELFGWGIEEMKMPHAVYHVFKNGGTSIGGALANSEKGAPSRWLSYVSVADVDKTAKSMVGAGGKVVDGPRDIPTVGREAAIADPKGAVFSLFKGAESDPDEKPQASGDWHWNELWTTDAQAALSFYEKELGYTHDSMDMPHGTYYVLKAGGVPRGGLMQTPDPKVSPMWLGYVKVKDVDATAKRATALGAKVLKDLDDVPGVGRYGIFQDPTGAVIGIITPAQAS